jgi:hypothetical protein
MGRSFSGARPAGHATRRELLHAGGLGTLSFSCGWPSGLQAGEAGPNRFGQARSVIILSLYGGPPQQDTFDPKPEAPDTIRGEFDPIDTSVPGTRICEHLPRLAQLAHQYAIVRSVAHPDARHYEALYTCLTGWPFPRQRSADGSTDPSDAPHLAAVMGLVKPPTLPVPPFVVVGGNHINGIGQNGGFLGSGHNPLIIEKSANAPDFRVPPGMTLTKERSVDRVSGRSQLLHQIENLTRKLEGDAAAAGFSALQNRALKMLTRSPVPAAFDMESEPVEVRDRYGRFPVGQNLLLARRLAEAGVPVIHVSYDPAAGWDSHSNNFSGLKSRQLPSLDQSVSALLEDLQQRGSLDQTMVIVWGEFGRTPIINKKAGRDHWPYCYSALLAGGGVQGGVVYGASDKHAAYPASNPVGPWDVGATMLHCAGIDPRSEVLHPQQNRNLPISRGKPILPLL